jgi:RNA polymerase sigma-70 factor, ECF subfamily
LIRVNIDGQAERELTRRIASGDEAAFDTVFRAYYPQVVWAAESVLRERSTAEELAQDVMLELWRRRESLRLETSLRAYLYQAARNRALNHIRHEKIVLRSNAAAIAEGPAESPAADSRIAEGELDSAIREAVARLPERCRETFELSRTQGLKYAEIAAVLGVSVKTVEARMGQALRELRRDLAAWLPSKKGGIG